MSLAMTPSPLPLVPNSALRPSMPSEISRLLAAQRLALLGYSRQVSSPLVVPSIPLSTQSPQLAKNAQQLPQSTLSSVARRKLRIASNSVPSYALGIMHNADQMSPTPSTSNNDSNSSKSTQEIPILASVGVVDMRFLTRQPPTVQKPETPMHAKSASKESSVGTPTSPSAPLAAGPTPKNQRPKTSNRAAPAATTNGKSNSSSTATTSNKPDDNKDTLKSKHAFLFRPESEQPTSGPYVRYSPMYHYYHPYRNMHREAIKAEWSRLHPVVERIPPPEEEEAVTPPRRTSGRQKKTNVRGVAARGRDKSSKKGAAAAAAAAVTTSQNNDTIPASPLLPNGRRSRANAAKAKSGGAKSAKGKGGRASGGGAANKRKRAEFEEDDKPGGGKEEVIPTPKRPKRGAAALAAIATAALEADDAGSNKDEGSPIEAQDDGEPKTAVKRRMRPNARKTAAARAAAMEAKKQKKRSTEDGEASEDEAEGENDNDNDPEGDGEGALESLKDDESVSKPDESQPAETPGDDHDLPLGASAGAEKDENTLENEIPADGVEGEQEPEPELERKTKATRGKGGFGAKGSRAKTKRGGFGAQKRASTRGTPRGTPRTVSMDDEGESLPPDQEDIAPVGGRRNTRKIAAPGESTLGITVNSVPAGGKSKRSGGKKSRPDANEAPQEDEVVVDPMLLEEQMAMSQHINGVAEPDPPVMEDDQMSTSGDHTVPAGLE